MQTIYETLMSLAPSHDDELTEGYRRYEARLATILTPEQMATYAAHIRQTGTVRILEELTTGELAQLSSEERTVVELVRADNDVSMENRRVVALLNQRDEHAVAPDLGKPEPA